jgi:predicted MFS family arabinose efflux permease
MGTWIHEVGAGWLMSTLDPSPEMVSAVRTAMATPIVLLAIPAGVLADRFDRRRLLMLTQILLFATASTLSALTFSGVITAWMLLALTAVMGIGWVIHVPTWQASIPELVTRRQLPRAVALGSVSFNLARAMGPAVGGFLIAALGTWIAFAINAISFAGVFAVLILWHRQRSESSRGLSYWVSLQQGVRYVAGKASIRHALFGVGFFVVPASAFWALLPLVVKLRLGWDADGFGLLVATFGFGAVIAAWLLPQLQARLGTDWTVAGAMVVFALALMLMCLSVNGSMATCATFVMGGTWMMTLTTLNATAQVSLPNRMRARGMSCYVTAIALSMSLGSLLWGNVAGATDLVTAQIIAAATLLVTAAMSLKFHLGQSLT